MDDISRELSYIFGIKEEILIVGNDADVRDHDRTLRQVRQIFHKELIKLNMNTHKSSLFCLQGQL